jgi:Putative peptidoglycan binding domain
MSDPPNTSQNSGTTAPQSPTSTTATTPPATGTIETTGTTTTAPPATGATTTTTITAPPATETIETTGTTTATTTTAPPATGTTTTTTIAAPPATETIETTGTTTTTTITITAPPATVTTETTGTSATGTTLPATTETPGPVVPATSPGTALVPAGPTRVNPFRAVALLMKSVSDSLEAANRTGAPRRWVRIVRVREYLQGDDKGIIAQGVNTGVGAFIDGISYILRFTMLAYDLLRQGDAVKALFEVSTDFIDKVADPEFINSITSVVDGPQVSTTDNPLAVIKTVTGEARKYVDKVPEPEDLDLIGLQLYRMLVVEQLPPEAEDADHAKLKASNNHIDLQLTGKLRLLNWGLARSFTVREVVKGKDIGVTCLGARRVWRTTDVTAQPQHSRGEWRDPSITGSGDTVFDFYFTAEANGSKDLDETRDILKALGYSAGTGPGFDATLSVALQQFQVINGLTQTGELDNATINQLMHLKYDPDPAKGGLRRAKVYNRSELETAKFSALA